MGWLVRHVFCQFTKRKYNFIDWYAEKGCRYTYPYKKIAQCMLLLFIIKIKLTTSLNFKYYEERLTKNYQG